MGEIDRTYFTNVDGKWTNVVPLEESFRSVKAHIEMVEERNKYLEEENKKLKDEHYKDAEIQDMKSKLEESINDLYRGFPIYEDEYKKIESWKKKHDEEAHGADYENNKFRNGGAIGGSYTYEFTPTSIGVLGRVRCTCGAYIDFGEV